MALPAYNIDPSVIPAPVDLEAPPPPAPTMSENRADFLTTQYFVAQDETDPAVYEDLKRQIKDGNESLLREQLYYKTKLQDPLELPDILKKAIEGGDVATAKSVLKGQVEPIPYEFVTEVLASEAAQADMVADPSYDQYEAEKTSAQQSTEINDRALILAMVNGLQQAQEMAAVAAESRKHIRTPFFSGSRGAVVNMGMDGNPDMMEMMVPMLLSTEREGLQGYKSGTEAAARAAKIFDPNMPYSLRLELVNSIITGLKEKLVDDPLLQENPLAWQIAMYENFFAGQDENPELLRLRNIKEFSDGMSNPLPDIYDPESFFDATLNKEGVLNFFNYLDIGSIVATPLMAARNAALASRGVKLANTSIVRQTALAAEGKAPSSLLKNVLSLVPDDADINPWVKQQLTRLGVMSDAALEDRLIVTRVDPTPEQAAKIAIKGKEEFGKKYLGWVIDYDGNNPVMRYKIGNTKGLPFATEEAANAANKKLYEGKYTVLPLDPVEVGPRRPGYVLQATRNINEYGLYDKSLFGESRAFNSGIANVLDKTSLGRLITTPVKFVGRKVVTPAVDVAMSLTMRGKSAALERAKLSEIFDRMLEPVRNLNKVEAEAVAKVINKGKTLPSRADPDVQGRWLNIREFDYHYYEINGRLPTDKERLAYFANRMASDTAYELRNEAVRKGLMARGVNEWTFRNHSMGSGLGNRVAAPHAIADFSKILMPDGTVVGKSELTAKKGWSLFSLDGNVNRSGTEITHVFAKDTDSISNGLPTRVLGYREGGAREYANVWFIKQDIMQEVAGTRVRTSARTFETVPTEADAVKRIETLEKARRIYKEFRESRQLITTKGAKASSLAKIRLKAEKELSIQAPEFDLDKLDEMYDAGKLDPNEPFQHVFDKESMLRDAGPRQERLQMYQQKGRLYYSQRGEILNDPTIGREAAFRDPFETLSKELNEAVKQAAWKDFAIQSAGNWYASFGKYYTADVALPQPDELLKYGKWNQPNTPKMEKIRKLSESQRQYVLRMLEHPTSTDIWLAQTKSRIGQAIASQWGKNRFEAIRTGRIATETQAMQALQSFTFDAYMGFMNFAQLTLQASAIGTAVMLHPIKGAAAVRDLIPLRIMSIMDFDPVLAKTMDKVMSSKLGQKTLGWKPGEFLEMIEDYRKSGIHIVGRSNALLDNAGIGSSARVSATSSALARGASRTYDAVKYAGRQPFYEMERWGRIVAFGIARREAQELVDLKKFAKGSVGYRQYIQSNTNKYTLNMMSGMETWWQRNPAIGTFTKFMQYPVKYAEVFLGLNREFTQAERFNFIFGNTFMWGSYGVPLGPQMMHEIAPMYEESTGQRLDEQTYDALMLGIGNELVGAVLGEDVALAPLIGAGDFPGRFIQSLVGNEKSPLGVYGGAPLEAAKRAGGAVYDMVKLGAKIGLAEAFKMGEAGVEYVPEKSAWAIFASAIKSASNVNKAYLLARSQVLVDRNGSTIAENVDYPWFLSLVGVPPKEEWRSFDDYHYSKIRNQLIDDNAKIFSRMLEEGNRAVNEERFDDFQKIQQAIDIHGQSLEPDILEKAFQKGLNMAGMDREVMRAKNEGLPYKADMRE